MAVSCPLCHKSLTLPSDPGKEGFNFFCQNCGKRLKVEYKITPWDESGSPKIDQTTMQTPGAPRIVLVAVEGEVTHEMINEILSQDGIETITASDGKQALELLREIRPKVSIVDVGLPYAFESLLSDKVRGVDYLQGLRIILLSSIHDKTKYKREPESLYGADDYLERHHIHDQLLKKVNKCFDSPSGEKTSEYIKPVVTKNLENLRSDEKTSEIMENLAAHDTAKRLARIIISDIALYNQKKIEEGLRNNTFKEILSDEIKEGLKLYQNRTPKEVLESTTYYEDALSDFIQKQKSKMVV